MFQIETINNFNIDGNYLRASEHICHNNDRRCCSYDMNIEKCTNKPKCTACIGIASQLFERFRLFFI